MTACKRCGELTDRHHTAKYCFPCAKIKEREYYAKRNERERKEKEAEDEQSIPA